MKRNRTLIVSALVAGLGPLLGNSLYVGPDGGESILAEARDGLPVAAHAGLALELVGFIGLLLVFAWLVVFLLDRTPIAAAVAGVAGAAMVAVKVGSAAPLMVVHATPEKLDPMSAEVLISLNDQAFVVSGFLMCLAFTAAGSGLLASDFPRWLAWWATAAGGLGVVAGLVGIVRPEAYVPIPFLLLLVWLIAVAITAATGRNQAGAPVQANRSRRPVGATQ